MTHAHDLTPVLPPPVQHQVQRARRGEFKTENIALFEIHQVAKAELRANQEDL